MPDYFVWIVRSPDMIILAVDFTLNLNVASSLANKSSCQKIVLKLARKLSLLTSVIHF